MLKILKNVLVTSIINNKYDVEKKTPKDTYPRKKEPSMVHKNNMPFLFS